MPKVNSSYVTAAGLSRSAATKAQADIFEGQEGQTLVVRRRLLRKAWVSITQGAGSDLKHPDRLSQ